MLANSFAGASTHVTLHWLQSVEVWKTHLLMETAAGEELTEDTKEEQFGSSLVSGSLV